VIESRAVKWFVVTSLLAVAAYFAVGARPSRRIVGYLLGGIFAAPALYILVRVHPRAAPPRAPGSILGDVDAFLAEVPQLALRFRDWAKARGLNERAEPDRFLEWVWEHREAIGAEWGTMLPMAAAAYGEILRNKDHRAVWNKRRGDAIVEIPGRP
jgi:hypothetical protein